MIKRIIGVTTSVLLATTLFIGCGGSGKSYSLTEKNTIEGIVEYQIKNIELVNRVDPTNPNEEYKYFKPSKEENKLLDVEIEVKNLKSENVLAKDLLDTQMGTINMSDGNKAVESFDGGELLNTSEEQIKGNESRLMHFIYEVDSKVVDTKIKLDIIIGEKRFSQKIKVAELSYPKNTVKVGDSITKDNYAEVKILSVEDKEKLEPSKAAGVYTSYFSQYEDGKLKVLTAEIKNLSDKELLADKVIALSAIYGEECKFARATCESEDGKSLEYASTVKIAPNSTKKVYLYYDMKAEEINKQESLKISFGMDKFILE